MRAALQNNNIPRRPTRRSIPKCRYLNVTPIIKSIKIKNTTLDPLVPYGCNETVYIPIINQNVTVLMFTDTDGDQIPDVVESMLSNASHFLDFYNFTHKQDL